MKTQSLLTLLSLVFCATFTRSAGAKDELDRTVLPIREPKQGLRIE